MPGATGVPGAAGVPAAPGCGRPLPGWGGWLSADPTPCAAPAGGAPAGGVPPGGDELREPAAEAAGRRAAERGSDRGEAAAQQTAEEASERRERAADPSLADHDVGARGLTATPTIP